MKRWLYKYYKKLNVTNVNYSLKLYIFNDFKILYYLKWLNMIYNGDINLSLYNSLDILILYQNIKQITLKEKIINL